MLRKSIDLSFREVESLFTIETKVTENCASVTISGANETEVNISHRKKFDERCYKQQRLQLDSG